MNFPKFLRIAMNALTYYSKENGTIVFRLLFEATFKRIAEIFAQALGFSYQLLPPEDGEFGTRLPNGTWTGVMGMLHCNEAYLAITHYLYHCKGLK